MYIALFILFILIVLYLFSPSRKEVLVNGRKWSVIDTYPNHQQAAYNLSIIHSRMIAFMRKLKHKYQIDYTREEMAGVTSAGATSAGATSAGAGVSASVGADVVNNTANTTNTLVTPSSDARKCIETLLTNYNPDVFYENDPRLSNETSYTMNKGDSMYICLRDKKNPNRLIPVDTVFFVMLHECAHIANYNGWGHDTRFWTVFKFIIHEAVLAGVYTPIDYVKHPEQYCGIEIYYQPLYDDSLPDL